MQEFSQTICKKDQPAKCTSSHAHSMPHRKTYFEILFYTFKQTYFEIIFFIF